MGKNGETLILLLEHNRIIPGIWDPYRYRSEEGEPLSQYVGIEPTRSMINKNKLSSKFSPLEYKNIPRGDHLSFSLEERTGTVAQTNYVSESTLLFGTMRAYLGNVIITPKAEWIDMQSPITFPIKSEFVIIKPKDGLIYFWWAYLKSRDFLKKIPVGGGKTRPRLHIETMLKTPVNIPSLDIRTKINTQLLELSEKEWRIQISKREMLFNHFGLLIG